MTSTQARSRPGPFGAGTSSSNNASNRGFGSGFGSGNGAWNEGIWSGKAVGSGMKSAMQENMRAQNNHQGFSANAETVTGSGSLLSSSESEKFIHRQGSWKSVDPSPSLSRVHTNGSNTPPIHRQNSNQIISHSFNDTNSANSTYFSVNPASTNLSSRSSQKNFLDPTSGSFVAGAFDSNSLSQASRHNSDEENRFAARKMAFEGTDTVLGVQAARPSFNTSNNVSGYTSSSAASRSGSMPPSRGDADAPARYPVDNSQYSRYNSSATNRQNLSAQAPSYTMPVRSSSQKVTDQLSSSQVNQLLGEFGNLNMSKDNSQNSYTTQGEISYTMASNYGNGFSQESISTGNEVWNREDNGYQPQQEQLSPTGSGSGSLSSQQGVRRGISFGAQYSQSPSLSDARLGHSPYYSAAGTPPTYQQRAPSQGSFGNGTLVTGQTALLERRLRGLQQEQQAYLMPRGAQMHFGNQFSHPPAYDFHSQPGLRMNGQLNPYYPMPHIPHHIATQHIPRGPARENDVVQPVRSALLEEFRNNSKTNKRYELKDIYNHIVEFSGDQHGSRFIQQKLETANSDEKDQVFRELFPNAIQLMTDVFGNYVIQKFFEHGNQSQKKILANQMRTHILTLSTQMYGCRVVQKALEHILTDQQAQLVRELEHNVLKCVKDQNGNHVVQKAIERVPAEHIRFILNAFTGQVQSLATHPYGCRVIQRMLEHCDEPTQTSVLVEIHASASSLILDQFGNYVAQHIIEHGRDEDRAKLVSLVISQLSNFSKHKFASNVVEKTIQFGSKEERDKIVATLTVVNDKGESPSQSLIRDQYGNYVIQKLLNELKDSERDDFVELIKAQLALLKRFSYGKQIAAIEKLIYTTPFPPQQYTPNGLPPSLFDSGAPTPPPLTDAAQSPTSSSFPSTHASSVNGPNESRKSSGSNDVGVMTPTST